MTRVAYEMAISAESRNRKLLLHAPRKLPDADLDPMRTCTRCGLLGHGEAPSKTQHVGECLDVGELDPRIGRGLARSTADAEAFAGPALDESCGQTSAEPEDRVRPGESGDERANCAAAHAPSLAPRARRVRQPESGVAGFV